MGIQDFENQLKDLGFHPFYPQQGFIAFEYEIPVGSYVGECIQLAFKVPNNFPATPPHGPHVKPHFFPIVGGGNGQHPYGGVHKSELGEEWQHWSRQFNEWNNMDRSVKTYLAFIRKLFTAI